MRLACVITHATMHVQERFNSMHPAYYHLADGSPEAVGGHQ